MAFAFAWLANSAGFSICQNLSRLAICNLASGQCKPRHNITLEWHPESVTVCVHAELHRLWPLEITLWWNSCVFQEIPWCSLPLASVACSFFLLFPITESRGATYYGSMPQMVGEYDSESRNQSYDFASATHTSHEDVSSLPQIPSLIVTRRDLHQRHCPNIVLIVSQGFCPVWSLSLWSSIFRANFWEVIILIQNQLLSSVVTHVVLSYWNVPHVDAADFAECLHVFCGVSQPSWQRLPEQSRAGVDATASVPLAASSGSGPVRKGVHVERHWWEPAASHGQ